MKLWHLSMVMTSCGATHLGWVTNWLTYSHTHDQNENLYGHDNDDIGYDDSSDDDDDHATDDDDY